MKKPNIQSQLASQIGMGRPGGMMSRMAPPVKSTKGSNFAAMEATLLKGKRPDPKKLASGKAGRQFFVKAAGGDSASGVAKVPGSYSGNPTGLNRVLRQGK